MANSNMTSEDFLKYFKNKIHDLLDLTAKAQKEYADPNNVFDNFDRLAADLHLDRKHILYVYMKKHLDAIRKYIAKDLTAENMREPITGRIDDVIVYLMILRAMVTEEQNLKIPSLENLMREQSNRI